MTEPSFATLVEGAYESNMWIRRNQTSPRLLWIRLVLLVCFVLGQTPLLPAGVGAALWLEGSHQVEVQGTSGQFRLVLHHVSPSQSRLVVRSAEHQHGWVSRLLVADPPPFGGPHPDHLLSFVSETAASPATAYGVDFKSGADVPSVLPMVDGLARHGTRVEIPCPWTARPCLRIKHPACLSTIVLLV